MNGADDKIQEMPLMELSFKERAAAKDS